MADYIENLSKALDDQSIAHNAYHDCIHIQLPNGFGVLEIKIWDGGEDSIQLLDGDFHTHAELESLEFNLPREEAVAMLARKVFYGEYLLIEEEEPGKEPRKLIAKSQENYLKFLPEKEEYKIANEI